MTERHTSVIGEFAVRNGMPRKPEPGQVPAVGVNAGPLGALRAGLGFPNA